MALLPKEHGAYGQLIIPAATAFAVAGVSPSALFVAATTVGGFLAHEPAAVLLGSRGVRARREDGREARIWLLICGVMGLVSLVAALATMPDDARVALAVPTIPAAVVAWLTTGRREKTWYGEVAAACAFALAAVPIAMAAGSTLEAALNVSLPFVALFAASTLAVRAVIARVRGGGDPKVASAARRAALSVTAASAVLIGGLVGLGWVGMTTLVAAAPGLIVAAVLGMYPPPPAKLRTVGWALVATSIVTAVLVVVGSWT